MNSPTRVSILVTDVGLPALGHVIELARLLEPHVGVQVVGPDLGRGVNPMYRDAWPLTIVDTPRMYRWPEWFRDARRMLAACEGDLLIADKAFANTLGVALMGKRRQGKKVVLYLDEWDGASLSQQPVIFRLAGKVRHLHHPLEGCWFDHWEKKAAQADLVIGSTSFLRDRFQGARLDLGTDCQRFQPAAHPGLREELGLKPATPLVVFGGVARPHKGLEALVEALPEGVELLIVGPETDFARQLAQGANVHCTGAQPKAEMPRFLSLADVIALPLRDDLLAQSQMPLKIFEALAMGKPVVATQVADLPRILEGCGSTVPAGDRQALHDAIAAYTRNPALAQEHGAAARAKALAEFDFPVVSEKLFHLLCPLLEAS